MYAENLLRIMKRNWQNNINPLSDTPIIKHELATNDEEHELCNNLKTNNYCPDDKTIRTDSSFIKAEPMESEPEIFIDQITDNDDDSSQTTLNEEDNISCSSSNTNINRQEAYNGLSARYGGDDNLSALKNVLLSWNLGHLFDYFLQQDLYLGVLKHLTTNQAENLFQNTKVSLGARIEFTFQWSKWIKSINQNFKTPTCTEDKQHNKSCQKNNTDDTPKKYSEIHKEKINEISTKNSIDLKDLLSSTLHGRIVLTAYKNDKSLNDNLRQIIVEAVLQYCAANNHDLTVNDCASVTSQICEAFPGELASYYYVERKNRAPLGKLYNKYRNWKYKMNRKTKVVGNEPKKHKQNEFSVADDEDEHFHALKHGFDEMTYEQKLKHWRACAALRMNFIRNGNNLTEIFYVWPQYNLQEGFCFIESDFTFLYGSKNEVLHKIKDFCYTMLEKLFPAHKKPLIDCGFINLFDKIVKEKHNLSPNAFCASVFYLLQPLLPRSRISKKLSLTNANEKKRFYTIKESQDSFMTICATEAEYTEMYNTKVAAGISGGAPFISLIGTLEEPQSFLINFDNFSHKCHNFCKALDICFKVYNVFNIAYAESCEPMWEFINSEFYNLPSNGKHKPALEILLNEIKLIKEASNQIDSIALKAEKL